MKSSFFREVEFSLLKCSAINKDHPITASSEFTCRKVQIKIMTNSKGLTGIGYDCQFTVT